MRILIVGGHGFIGRHLTATLRVQGHDVVRPHGPAYRFSARSKPDDWLGALTDVDAAINLAGIFRERGDATFDAVHRHGPAMLAVACVAAGVRRLVHLSALGADDSASTPYHRSKKAGDDALRAIGALDLTIAQPSLVFGPDGASSRAFLMLAALPVLPLPDGGGQRIQPIHVDDLARALAASIEAPRGRYAGQSIAMVGPQATTLAGYLQDLRAGMGLPLARVVAVPRALVEGAARIGDRLPGALFDRASWSMLQRGNVADPAIVTQLLGRTPMQPRAFIAPQWSSAMRTSAQWGWQRWLLRGALAVVWLATAAVSFGLYPVQDSLGLLARAGVPAAMRTPMLFGAAALDLLIGLLTLAPLRPRHARLLWWTQIALIVFYTIVITLRLPEYWLHPYGPVLKNLPMLAVLAILAWTERPARHAA